MTQTETRETMTATLATDCTFHAGRHDRIVKAGTPIVVDVLDVESGRAIIHARVAGNSHISEYVWASALIPA
jgi:hypothetical protein